MADRFIDPVVAEIHAIRAALLDAAGGEIAVLMRQVAERQEHSTRRIVREPLRNRTEQTDARETSAVSVLNPNFTPRSP